MTRLEQSRVLPADVATTFDAVLPVDLEDLLGRRYLGLPGIASVNQDRPWGEEVGQTRTLHFTDGSRATEVLTGTSRPDRFAYRLTELRGPMRLIAADVRGTWSFDPADAGSTRVTWTWDVAPTLAGRVVMPVFSLMWRGMAARCLAELETQVAA